MGRTFGLLRAALLLTVVLFGAACTGSDEVAGPQATATGGPSPTAEAIPTTAPDPSGSPTFLETDSVLRVAIPQPATLDPMRIGDPASVLIARQLFEGLTNWDPITQTVVPAAASSWKAEDNGRTWTFELNPGMTFHDGQAVTADDFKFAFDRIALRKNASDIAYTLEMVDGFLEVNQLGSAKKLRGVKVKDDYTLEFDLVEPYYDFPAILTHPGLVPVPETATTSIDAFLASPVGNGSFKMAQPWQGIGEVDLAAFDAALRVPLIDGIRMIPFADASESWILFGDEQLDISEVPVGQFDLALEDFGDQGYKPFLAGYYFGFNLKTKTFQDKKVREAVSIAIDREDISQRIYAGSLVPPRGVVPVGIPGFEEDVCGHLCEFLPEEARDLVAKLSDKERVIRLDYTNGQPHGKVATAIERNLEDVGFDVRPNGYAFTRYLKRLRAGDQGFFRFGWISEYPLADVFLSSLFDSGSSDNQTSLKDDRVDSLLRKAHAEKDDATRNDLYLQAERRIMSEVPVVPIGTFVIHWAALPGVQGLNFDVMGGFDAATISLTDG